MTAIDYKKLPLGTTSFSDFILKSKVYVDKTDLVANIAVNDYPLFLARPRRFGKSTLVSTFEELFSHGLEKFKGLKIDTQNLWSDKTYKVLHLDLSQLKDNDVNLSFQKAFLSQLNDAFTANGFTSFEDLNIKTPDQYLRKRFISSEIKDRLVLLIDEYDAPLTTVMGDPQEFTIRRDFLSKFFLTVKSYTDKFRFIFITGVTRYSHVSIFSAFNNIIDLSFNPLYGAILGFTQEDLEFYFKDYLENAAHALNEENNTTEYTYEKILEEVKVHYDGYSFDKKCRTHVYNPWSILNFLSAPQDGFGNYWLDTGGSKPSILVNYFKSVIVNKLDKSELLKYTDENIAIPVDPKKLSPTVESIEENNFPFEAILYQAGYFTIKGVTEFSLKIGIPNLEVKQSFAEIILESLTNKSRQEFGETYKKILIEYLENKDLAKLQDVLNKIINCFSYESIRCFNEASFRDLLNFTAFILKIPSSTEVLNAYGRVDLCIEVDKYYYIFELKVAQTQNEVASKLKEAKEQIIKNKYARVLKDKQVVALALVVINQAKDHDLKPIHELGALEEVV